MDRNHRRPKAAEVAAWLLLRLLEWHRADLGKTANAGGMEVTAGRKVRFMATLDGAQFCVTVEEVKPA